METSIKTASIPEKENSLTDRQADRRTEGPTTATDRQTASQRAAEAHLQPGAQLLLTSPVEEGGGGEERRGPPHCTASAQIIAEGGNQLNRCLFGVWLSVCLFAVLRQAENQNQRKKRRRRTKKTNNKMPSCVNGIMGALALLLLLWRADELAEACSCAPVHPQQAFCNADVGEQTSGAVDV